MKFDVLKGALTVGQSARCMFSVWTAACRVESAVKTFVPQPIHGRARDSDLKHIRLVLTLASLMIALSFHLLVERSYSCWLKSFSTILQYRPYFRLRFLSKHWHSICILSVYAQVGWLDSSDCPLGAAVVGWKIPGLTTLQHFYTPGLKF